MPGQLQRVASYKLNFYTSFKGLGAVLAVRKTKPNMKNGLAEGAKSCSPFSGPVN